jgi:DNA-binding NarL/FixJ family response regulator
MKAIRILLVDDQPNVRHALALRLQIEPDIAVVGEAGDGPSTIVAVRDLEPDVLVLDYEMPGMNGIDVTNSLAASGCATAVVMLSLHDEAALKEAAVAAGAHAFVAKHESSDRLLAAIRSAASWSSVREGAL